MTTSEEKSAPTDQRFLLANERTFLAYVRTALSLQVAGLAVIQFLTRSGEVVRIGLGASLVVAGTLLGLAGYRRFRHNDRAIRDDAEMTSAKRLALVVVVLTTVPVLVAVVLAALPHTGS